MTKEAEIKFLIKLDENDMPDDIYWSATDSESEGFEPCDSLMISMWDRGEKNTMGIDLWTGRMEVGEMSAHFYHTLMKMADTYKRATGDEITSDKIQTFAGEFARSVEEFAGK